MDTPFVDGLRDLGFSEDLLAGDVFKQFDVG